jgi:hypothetical protein
LFDDDFAVNHIYTNTQGFLTTPFAEDEDDCDIPDGHNMSDPFLL